MPSRSRRATAKPRAPSIWTVASPTLMFWPVQLSVSGLDAPDKVRGAVIEELQRALGKDHAEAIGRVGGVLLEDADIALGVAPLQEIGEVEPGRAAAHDRHFQRHLPAPLDCPPIC